MTSEEISGAIAGIAIEKGATSEPRRQTFFLLKRSNLTWIITVYAAGPSSRRAGWSALSARRRRMSA